MVYTIKPRSDVCCFKLNFNISNVRYYQLPEKLGAALTVPGDSVADNGANYAEITMGM